MLNDIRGIGYFRLHRETQRTAKRSPKATHGEPQRNKSKMNKMDHENKYSELTSKIIACAIEVHKALGPGLLESAYEECLAYELRNAGLRVEQQKALPVVYKDIKLDCGYRIDILVEDTVVVELKSVDALSPVHEAQILTYLKFSEKKIGLLMNFNVTLLKNGMKRYML